MANTATWFLNLLNTDRPEGRAAWFKMPKNALTGVGGQDHGRVIGMLLSGWNFNLGHPVHQPTANLAALCAAEPTQAALLGLDGDLNEIILADMKACRDELTGHGVITIPVPIERNQNVKTEAVVLAKEQLLADFDYEFCNPKTGKLQVPKFVGITCHRRLGLPWFVQSVARCVSLPGLDNLKWDEQEFATFSERALYVHDENVKSGLNKRKVGAITSIMAAMPLVLAGYGESYIEREVCGGKRNDAARAHKVCRLMTVNKTVDEWVRVNPDQLQSLWHQAAGLMHPAHKQHQNMLDVLRGSTTEEKTVDFLNHLKLFNQKGCKQVVEGTFVRTEGNAGTKSEPWIGLSRFKEIGDVSPHEIIRDFIAASLCDEEAPLGRLPAFLEKWPESA